MNMKDQHLATIAVATPSCVIEQERAMEYIQAHYTGKLKSRSMEIVKKVFGHPGIRRRRFAFDDPACLFGESPDGKIERFTSRSIELSAQAADTALKDAGLKPQDVSALIVNTCTGYICPGISTYLIEKLGLNRNIRAYDLVGSGCGGAIPNLQLGSSILSENPDNIVLSISVEICSSTFQMGDDLSLIVSNALFGDGAAAAVFWNRTQGLSIVNTESLFETRYREDIRFIHKGGQLHNQLSKNLPRLVAPVIKEAVDSLLRTRGLSRSDITHWALHSGGENVINAIRDELCLSEKQLLPTREILSEYGNMSSPTVWFVLKNILEKGVASGEWCMAVAFGAGFSAHTCLLRSS